MSDINFTDFVMSRYARKATAKGAMIGRLKQGVLAGRDPATWCRTKLKDSRASAEERNTVNEILADWVKELAKIEKGTSKVEKFAGGRKIDPADAAPVPYTIDLGALYEEWFS